MRRILSVILLSLFASSLTAVASAQVQPAAAPATSASPPSASPAPGSGPAIPGFNDVIATIAQGTKSDNVTKGEVMLFASKYNFTADDDPDTIYRVSVDALVNSKLLKMFLTRQNIAVPAEKIDEQLEQLKAQLKTEGQDLATTLLQNNISMDDVRKEFEGRLRWDGYLKPKATDAALRKYIADNRDLFNGTQLRASHILIKVEPNASEADKEKVKQKLANIKKEIEAGTLTFAAAANKYSEDPANSGGAGGDLDYFTLGTGLVEEFTNVAFKMKKGTISDPVETPFGFHLIQITDRKEGKPVDFEQNKPYIMREFATELQKSVVTAERKTAKIDTKPRPKDLFNRQGAATTTAPAGADEKTPAKPAGAATPKQ
jgi:parvulin-like peptidyl-prolyl isomerase